MLASIGTHIYIKGRKRFWYGIDSVRINTENELVISLSESSGVWAGWWFVEDFDKLYMIPGKYIKERRIKTQYFRLLRQNKEKLRIKVFIDKCAKCERTVHSRMKWQVRKEMIICKNCI